MKKIIFFWEGAGHIADSSFGGEGTQFQILTLLPAKSLKSAPLSFQNFEEIYSTTQINDESMYKETKM